MIRRKRVAVAGGTVVAALCLAFTASPSWAGTRLVGFNVNMPWQGLFTYTDPQTKTHSGSEGEVNITSVGSSYLANARMCYMNANGCAAATTGLDDGTSGILAGGMSGDPIWSGETVQLGLNSTNWNAVSVQVIGSWLSD